MLSRPLALVFAVLVLALVGCSTPTVIPPASPASEGQPLFATDEEALAAATEAYEEFLAALDLSLADPTTPVVDLEVFATGDVLEQANAAIETFRDLGWRAEGARQVIGSSLQQVIPDPSSAVVTIYVCESAQGVDVFDEAGQSQVAEDREDLTGFEVSVGFSEDLTGVVEERTQWPASDVCDL